MQTTLARKLTVDQILDIAQYEALQVVEADIEAQVLGMMAGTGKLDHDKLNDLGDKLIDVRSKVAELTPKVFALTGSAV